MAVRSIYSRTPLKLRSISRLQILTTVRFIDSKFFVRSSSFLACSAVSCPPPSSSMTSLALYNRNPQCKYQLLFAFESALGSLSKNHTIASVPMGSYSFGASLQEGCFLYCRLSFSLPPSKIKDFCHLPRQREALVRCETAHYALHRTVYRSALLSVRQTGSCQSKIRTPAHSDICVNERAGKSFLNSSTTK